MPALPALPNPATPQGSPPVFTDPDLLAPGGVIIKALHITELRTAINDLRARLGLSAYSWQTSAAQGGLIKADPIVEMRTTLDQALGPPPSPGYSPGLAQYQPILAVHIQELRNRVVANWNSSSQIPPDGHANLSYELTTNRITTAGFAYDAAGNQVRALAASGASQRFQYDAANRLVKVKADNNQTVIASYTYGDSNERLIAEEGSLRTYYACDGKAEYVESGSSTTPQWSKTYIYLGARLLSTLTPNGSGGESIQYHHPDRLGTRLVTNAQDTNYFEQVTLPFGTALSAESTGATNRRFTTYDRNLNTGLDYAINRHYDPQQGRFTQVDPIGMSATSLTNPQSLNMYSYVGNDPVNRTDPTGLFWGKLWRAIKKIVTNKWFIIAVTVALAVITIGSAAFGWQLAKAVLVNIGTKAMPIMLPTGATTATTLGWVASGLKAALAIGSISFSAKAILGNAIGFAVGIGISQALSRIPMGTVGPGGTAGFNRNAGLGFDQGLRGLSGGATGRPSNVCSSDATWEYRHRDMRQIAAAVGGAYEKRTSTIEGTGSYYEVTTRLRQARFSPFINVNPEHFGGDDFQGRVNGSWYHVTVGRPKGIFGTPSDNPSWITVHCEAGGRPSNIFHVFR